MNQTKSLIRAALVGAIVLMTGAISFGQQKVDRSYEVALQVVIGSNDASRGALPANLSSISGQLKSTFPFSNYRLSGTFLGRISDNGSYEYKSVTNVLGQEQSGPTPGFLEWSLSNFRASMNDKGQPAFQSQGLRFGARVPVTTGTLKDESSGKSTPIVNYESIGLSANKFGLNENSPTLVGTLSLPGTSGMLFLIMTIKSAD